MAGFGYKNVFNKVLDEASVETVAPKVKQSIVTEETINKIFELLCSTFEMDLAPMIAGVCLLFLKGAASDGAPLSLSVEVLGREITKRDLLYCYEMVTGNKYLRRMAEALAVEISQYAEKNGLSGDLGKRIQTRHRASTGESLTPKELAWCSSFCQDLPNLANFSSERLAKLLAEDYDNRFKKAKSAPSANKKQQTKAKVKQGAQSKPKAEGSAPEASKSQPVSPPQPPAKGRGRRSQTPETGKK